ncbi:MAG: PIN domain-containing protein [Kiritimatiellae bacterium]|nr:PIN domain-containing protein [Kiritimatiellia bacterium]
MTVAVLDSFALLAYLRREPGYATICEALCKAAESRLELAMTEINYAEVKYIVLRKDGPSDWHAVENLLAVLPITFYPVDRKLANLAADFKARHKLSLADSCAAALAKRLKAVLYTGDAEFDALVSEIRLRKLDM